MFYPFDSIVYAPTIGKGVLLIMLPYITNTSCSTMPCQKMRSDRRPHKSDDSQTLKTNPERWRFGHNLYQYLPPTGNIPPQIHTVECALHYAKPGKFPHSTLNYPYISITVYMVGVGRRQKRRRQTNFSSETN